jgi:hypothetical protein
VQRQHVERYRRHWHRDVVEINARRSAATLVALPRSRMVDEGAACAPRRP